MMGLFVWYRRYNKYNNNKTIVNKHDIVFRTFTTFYNNNNNNNDMIRVCRNIIEAYHNVANIHIKTRRVRSSLYQKFPLLQ